MAKKQQNTQQTGGVQFESARDILAKMAQDQPMESAFPKNCATARILLQAADGKIIMTDMVISVEVSDEGKFVGDGRNPIVIHNTDNGRPIHQYVRLMSKDSRTGKVSDWLAAIASLVVLKGTRHVPAKEKPAEVAGSPAQSLGSPVAELDIPS